jgi:hypothetical protein
MSVTYCVYIFNILVMKFMYHIYILKVLVMNCYILRFYC